MTTLSAPGTAPQVSDAADILDRAKAFGEFAAPFDQSADRDRRLPDAVVSEMLRSGLVRLVRPARLGGLEVDLTTYMEALRTVANYSGAAAWVLGVSTIHEWFMAYTHPRFQNDVWGDNPDAFIVDSIAPTGEAVPTDGGGFTLSGRWKFVSGVEWSDWAGLGAIAVMPDSDGTPEPCMFFVPRRDFQVIDEWDAIGLRGTASNGVVVDGAHVPLHRVFPIARVAATGDPWAGRLDDGPLYHLPWPPVGAAGIFPIAVGLAQRGLAEFKAWTEKRLRPYEAGAAQRDNPAARLVLAESSAEVDAAHALLLRYAAQTETWGAEGHVVPTDEERARMFAWRGHIAKTCVSVVDRLYRESGAHALFPTHPLHQTFRDIHAATAHVSLAPGDAMTAYGNALFGGKGHPMI